ncbi:MAG: S-layer homology domain-containing protein [Clostridia bacterium]|nr:S-layer homology domain-containing protein [Clostridia bacterium]
MKKFFSVLLSTMLIFALILPASVPVVSAATTYSNDFESYQTTAQVQAAMAANGTAVALATDSDPARNKVLSVTAASKNVAITDISTVPQTGKWVYQFDLKTNCQIQTLDLYDGNWGSLFGLNSSSGDPNVKCSGVTVARAFDMVAGVANVYWHTYRFVFDAGAATYSLYVDGELKTSGTYNSQKKARRLRIQTLTTPSATNIMYLDNIVLKQEGVEITGVSPATGATGVEVNSNIALTFVNPPTQVEAGKISIKAGGATVNPSEYTVTATSANVWTIHFTNGMDYSKTYELTVDKSLTPPATGLVGMDSDFVTTWTTKSILPAITGIADGGTYSYSATPTMAAPASGVTIATTLAKDGGDASAYTMGTAITEQGSYVLAVTATETATGKTETKVFAFAIVGATAPVASNTEITASGEMRIGTVLTATYDYFDINGDAQSGSVGRWYKSTTGAEGSFTPCTDELTLVGNTSTYTIAENDYYYQFVVTPKTTVEPLVGEPDESSVFTGAFLPTVTDVKIEGEAVVGQNFTITSYDYDDVNGEAMNANTAYQWYRSTDGGETYDPILGETTNTHLVSNDDADALLYVAMIPHKGVTQDVAGLPADSNILAGPAAPVASDVTINGTASVGQSLYVTYTYTDVNGNKEDGTEITWYVDGVRTETGKHLTLTSDMVGAEISVTVQPKTTVYPQTGAPVPCDETVIVRSGSVRPSGGGGGRLPSSKNETPTTPATPTPSAPPAVTGFTDTASHWAKDSIKKMYDKGIVSGITETEFAPDMSITRAQAAVLFARAFELSGSADAGLSDVNGEWFAEGVNAVAAAGFMQGADGKFRPDDKITREEMAMVFYNIAKAKGLTFDASETGVSFDGVSGWALEAMKFANGAGLINGMDDGLLHSKDSATRAQFVVILDRFMTKGVEAPAAPETEEPASETTEEVAPETEETTETVTEEVAEEVTEEKVTEEVTEETTEETVETEEIVEEGETNEE